MSRTIDSKLYTRNVFRASRLRNPWKYFFLLALVISLGMLFISVVRYFADVKPVLIAIPSEVGMIYPHDLRLSLENGKLSTNGYPEPIYFDVDIFSKEIDWTIQDKPIKHLLTIDTNSETSLNAFFDKETVILATSDRVIAYNEYGGIETLQFFESQDFEITHELIRGFFNGPTWQRILDLAPYIYILFMTLWAFFHVVFVLIPLFFVALVVYGISQIHKKNYTFGSIYKAGLLAVTVGVLIDFIFIVFDVFIAGYWIPSVVALIVLMFDMYRTNSGGTESIPLPHVDHE